MADQLAAPADLGLLLERLDIDMPKATRLVEIATAIVQEAAGRPPQRILRVIDDEVSLMGSGDSWLDLPQRPVVSVSSVQIDGEAVTAGRGSGQYRLIGNRLYRSDGWATEPPEPSEVTVVYTHGYAPDDQGLQLAAGAVVSIIVGAYDNPEGLKAQSVDDWSATYNALAGQLETSKYLKAALRRQYGRPGGMVRIGG